MLYKQFKDFPRVFGIRLQSKHFCNISLSFVGRFYNIAAHKRTWKTYVFYLQSLDANQLCIKHYNSSTLIELIFRQKTKKEMQFFFNGGLVYSPCP